MKTLLIMRHAKSSWGDPGLADHDRPLNERGKADAPSMGAALREAGLVPEVILSSTAKRARQTAALAAEACGFEGGILLREDFYDADPADYLEGVRGVAGDPARVMIVGHNPGMTDLVEQLTGRPEMLSTANIAVVNFELAAWADLDDETEGELVRVYRPRG
jgi:phosphohistidine phosphatase